MSGTVSDKSETHTLKSSQKEENFREKTTKQNKIKKQTSIYRNFSATTSTFNQSSPWLATNPSLDPT